MDGITLPLIIAALDCPLSGRRVFVPNVWRNGTTGVT
jgi:hypothetical protein